jgi:hypothetical protein
MLDRGRPVSLRPVLFYFFICICTSSDGKDIRLFTPSLQLLVLLLCNRWQLQQLELSNERRNVLNIEFAVWLRSAYPDNKEGIGRGRIKSFETIKFQLEDLRF